MVVAIYIIQTFDSFAFIRLFDLCRLSIWCQWQCFDWQLTIYKFNRFLVFWLMLFESGETGLWTHLELTLTSFAIFGVLYQNQMWLKVPFRLFKYHLWQLAFFFVQDLSGPMTEFSSRSVSANFVHLPTDYPIIIQHDWAIFIYLSFF